MRTISYRAEDLRNAVIGIGYVGENERTQVRIDCGSIFAEYPAASAGMTIVPPAGAAYPKAVTRDGDVVVWDVTDSDLASEGSGEMQLSFVVSNVVVKSCIAQICVQRSITGNGPAPDPMDDWLTEANETLDDVQEALTAIPTTIDTALAEAKASGEFDGPQGEPGRDGQDGAPGADGFSPTATVTKSGKVSTISITDKNGTTTETVSDGESGAQIDDTAGEGDTDKTWSADKLHGELADVKTDITKLAPAATDFAKGAVASFSDGANNLPLNHLKVQIVPAQTGSGDPSPTNKRNITGRTGQTIFHSAEDTTNPTEYEDSWEDEAGTVFYGKRDIITGQLIIEAIMLTFDGSTDEGWTYNAYNDYNKYRYYISVSSYGVSYDDIQDVLFCNWLKPEVNGAQTTYTYGTNIVCMSSSRQWLFVALDISTVDALKTELATHPLQVVIKLATPSTYNLTPVEIDSLYGVNKFWSDAGDIIQCEYKADTALFVKDEIDSRNVEPQMTVKATTLEDDTITVIDGLMIRKNLDIEFMASITDFTSLIIGHGYNQDGAAYIVIDSTNVTVYANSGTQKAQYDHGLTIGTYIRVLIQQDDSALARLLIFTASGKYTKADIDFNGCTGDIFATVDGELSDVSLIAVLHDINKPIWFFGDSYQSMTKDGTSRWPYYLRDEGYIVNTLFAGRYGAFAQTLVPTFHKLLAIKKPKFIVWCLGMNGSDTNGELNTQWRDATNDVIDTCAEEGVTLILATIPNTPDRNNTKKNAYVKNTGLRYIDFAKAVGAEEAGSSWYTGMLSTDDLHPSNTGAMALYAQVLADLPEVMQNVKRGYEVWEGGNY